MGSNREMGLVEGVGEGSARFRLMELEAMDWMVLSANLRERL